MNSELIEILKRIFIASQLPTAFLVAYIGYLLIELDNDGEIPKRSSFSIKILAYSMFPSSVILLISFFQNI